MKFLEVVDSTKFGSVVLIDVRELKEVAELGTIPTSINVPCKF